ncbi:hypothetical protein DFP72DRAFT_1063417 [Ephemerocybe angulata]|uniref:Uncharacterized protein n=1 Tax=Ephemerocybe angulata TaxID=980116 RepID=A0A8H6MD52_9AGAR|nr:hypothetical protein DFP72DRAFT_1063417 [Tulosesus angulatus]
MAKAKIIRSMGKWRRGRKSHWGWMGRLRGRTTRDAALWDDIAAFSMLSQLSLQRRLQIAPVLISRFGDLEETVRLEVWVTCIALLNPHGKRKRNEEEVVMGAVKENNAHALARA